MNGASEQSEITIIGAGIVGLATALTLSKQPDLSVTILETEDRIAAHQSGHNSGVIHSGLYYTPGSAKARLCAAGRNAMYRFCEEHGIPFRRCGKIVVAADEKQMPALDRLERHGHENGLTALRRLNREQLREIGRASCRERV